jgi:hypothetical protein
MESKLQKAVEAGRALRIGLQEAIADLGFISRNANESDIAALAKAASAVASLYLSQAKGDK